MDNVHAEGFARSWVSAWNDRDIATILEHYSDTVVFHSPRIEQVMEGAGGVIRGKAALEIYWTKALEMAPKLYFALDKVLLGANSLTVLYTNHRDQTVAETFLFGADNKVIEAIAAYG